jgi:hypothetical protein
LDRASISTLALRTTRVPGLQHRRCHVFTALKLAFPVAAVALIGTMLIAGDGSLAIMTFVGCIAVVPLIYGPDVDEIARATRDGEFDH